MVTLLAVIVWVAGLAMLSVSPLLGGGLLLLGFFLAAVAARLPDDIELAVSLFFGLILLAVVAGLLLEAAAFLRAVMA